MRCSFVVAPLALVGVLVLGAPACATSTDDSSGPDAQADVRSDAKTNDTGPGIDSGPGETFCSAYLRQRPACGKTYLCEKNTASWCEGYAGVSSAISNAAYVRCATPDRCADNVFKDCLYLNYQGARTAAQDGLLSAVCNLCEPANVASCMQSNVMYDRGQGPDSVTDLFIAVWESSDSVATKMKTQCATKAGVDAGGADGGVQTPAACFRAFSQCAAGVYLDSIPACPK